MEVTTEVAKDNMANTNDMMRALQDEIQQVKSGVLSESTARVVSKFRTLQLKTAELELQYQRMIKGRTVSTAMPLIKA